MAATQRDLFAPSADLEALRSLIGTDADALLDRFGTLAAVVEATPQLHYVKEAAACFLRSVAASAPQETVSSWSALKDYLGLRMGGLGREQFRVLFLNNRNGLIADEVMGEGTVDHAPAYPREIARRALELDAANVILVHNHPSGHAQPSEADIIMTRDIVAALRPLKITVHDHCIVVRGGEIVSLKALGCF